MDGDNLAIDQYFPARWTEKCPNCGHKWKTFASDHIHAPNVVISLISMHNTFRAILAMTTFLVTGALSSCNHADELEPVSLAPQIVFLFLQADWAT